ncbi:uncharacterized protein LOC108161554 [Drosophila miranda]|uniref:uncharacterized protein LOC108161554 n=1 Tax=Drosophila miranda TaxID=7229 RepID=UPI0007E7F18C|nr:uncharacterized protein LOC108161554 [Drosophila miranda]
MRYFITMSVSESRKISISQHIGRMNSDIDLSSEEYQEPCNTLSTEFTTIEDAPLTTSTPIRTTGVIGVLPRVSVAIDSPFLCRIPRSLAHIKGRQGAPSHPFSGYASPFFPRIPRKFEHIKGRPGIRMTRGFYQNTSDTTKTVGHEHMFEAEVIDEEVFGSAVEALGSAVGVLGTTMTFLGSATGSEEQQVVEPQAEPEAENTADKKGRYLCSIS